MEVHSMSKGLKTVLIVAGILLLLIFAGFRWYVGGYNRVVAMDENVKGSWAEVENQLKRRYDLIPNLIETVKGYASHEKDLFQYIADARTKYFSAKTVKDKIASSNQLEGALSRLLLLREQYPQRKRYNNAVQLLNTYIRTVFGRFFAGFAGVTNAEYFEVPETEQAVPQVRF